MGGSSVSFAHIADRHLHVAGRGVSSDRGKLSLGHAQVTDTNSKVQIVVGVLMGVPTLAQDAGLSSFQKLCRPWESYF